MSNKPSRRAALKNLMAGSAAILGAGAVNKTFAFDEPDNKITLKGNINHSVCQWCFGSIPLEDLCKAVKEIGFSAIDLIAPKDWPTLQKYGIYSSMCYIGGKVSLTEGWNNKN